ncbi:ArsR/SmtB family transcription factor [Armatimonas sp.]|uniref:ArsR/SmtB family transcription factor n=1 Tax=Armatimonas sp. TaxID=1872638 RepID=UPI003750DB48
MNENIDYAAMFKALGDPTRLRIFQYLRSCCCGRAAVDEATGDARTLLTVAPTEAPSVGEVCCRVTGTEKITSALSVHLKELRTAGLIQMERRGKHILCTVNPRAVALLALYFSQEPEGSPQSSTTPKETQNNDCC